MSDWQRDKLVGSVRSIQVELAEANAVDRKLVEIKRWPHQRVTYDKRGHEVERVSFNQDGTEEDRSVIRYDSEGRIIGYGNAKKDRNHSTIEYDRKGNPVEARMYEGDAIQTREVYSYDEKGQKIEQSRFADGGAHRERLTYAYNAAGQLTGLAYPDPSGNNRFGLGYTYTAHGDLQTISQVVNGSATTPLWSSTRPLSSTASNSTHTSNASTVPPGKK